MKNFKVFLAAMFLYSSAAMALDCVAMKDGGATVKLTGFNEADDVKSALIEKYQFDQIKVQQVGWVLDIFDRRTPRSGSKTVIPDLTAGQTFMTTLKTQDGNYTIKCEQK